MREYIDKEKVIQNISSLTMYNERVPIDAVIEKVEHTESEDVVPTNQWISVKDKLPPYCGDYIVYVDKKDEKFIALAWHNIKKNTGHSWIIRNLSEYRNYITHWQPLPEPPKETKKSNYMF